MNLRTRHGVIGGVAAGLVLGGLVAVGQLGVAQATPPNSGHDHGNGSNSKVALDIIGDRCNASGLDLHNGFQSEDAVCVDTEFGEQSAFEKNPTLLITDSPDKVEVDEDIVLKVSTRNLVRDRFLGAAAGGYYLESAFLKEGLTRGHFHTGCRKLEDGGKAAPEPFRLGDRFVATEDGKGGTKPDTVTVTIKAFKFPGLVQCAAWAGDGSHRIPMMAFANEIPAFDAVRIEVKK
jgi:hypothetical protein